MAMTIVPRPFHGTSTLPVTKLARCLSLDDEPLDLIKLSVTKRIVLVVIPNPPTAACVELLGQLSALTSQAPISHDVAILCLLPDPLAAATPEIEGLKADNPSVCLCADLSGTLLHQCQLVNVNGSVIPAACVVYGDQLRLCNTLVRSHTNSDGVVQHLLGLVWSMRRTAEMASAMLHTALSDSLVVLSDSLRASTHGAASCQLPVELTAQIICWLPQASSPTHLVCKGWVIATSIAAMHQSQQLLQRLQAAVPSLAGTFSVASEAVLSEYPDNTCFPSASESQLWKHIATQLRSAVNNPTYELRAAGLECCTQLRAHGVELFVAKQLVPALSCFNTVLTALEGTQLPDQNERSKTLAVLLSNMAAVYRHMGDASAALWSCHRALFWCPGHVKARFQRAKLFVQDNKTKDAIKDLKMCLEDVDGAPKLREEASSLLTALQIGDSEQVENVTSETSGYGGYGGY